MATSLAQSFRNAFSGISHMLRTQRNAKIYLGITVAVALLAAWLRIEPIQWVSLVLAIGLVWTAELVNTAVESAVDLASPQSDPLAGTAKDVSAGAVLLAAITASIVGALILGPPLIARMLP